MGQGNGARMGPRSAKGYRLGVFLILLQVLPWGGAPAVGAVATYAASQSDVRFEEVEVVTGTADRQSVLTGFLLGGEVADIAVLNVDDEGDRRLRIYSFEESTWVPALETTLRSGVSFVDVARIDGRDRLVTYDDGVLSWFDPESAMEHALLALTSIFQPPRRDEVPHVDITDDVNDDGRDDLVVPGTAGFHVFTQTDEGSFSEPVTIGSPADLSRIYGADGYRYDPWSQSRVHKMDYNRDGRTDLVFWSDDHFVVHLQRERGRFGAEIETFTTEVTFDSDDLSSLTTGDVRRKVLHSISDMNGDGIGDLVVVSLEGARASRKRSVYEVHLGAPTPGSGTTIVPGGQITFRSTDTIQIGMKRLDLGRDGEISVMVTTIDPKFVEGSFWKTLKGAMGDDVLLDLEFYTARDGRFPDQPNVTRTIALDGAPSHREPGWVPLDVVLDGPTHTSKRTRTSWPRAFNRTVLIGDVTGDGRADLLMEPEFMELNVFVGVPGPELFARRPQKVAVSLHDEEYVWMTDLNRDGREDILLHHPFTRRDGHGARKRPPGTEPNRVTVLFSR